MEPMELNLNTNTNTMQYAAQHDYTAAGLSCPTCRCYCKDTQRAVAQTQSYSGQI
jgi:hypothetical protein